MSNNFHEACTKGTLDWFAAMLDYYPQPADTHDLQKADCITAVVTFGGTLKGAAALTFPEAALSSIIIRHTNEELAPQGQALYDAVLALKKIWASNMRVRLHALEAQRVFAAPPWLLRGSAASLYFPNCDTPVTSAFTSDSGPFLLCTAWQHKGDANA